MIRWTKRLGVPIVPRVAVMEILLHAGKFLPLFLSSSTIEKHDTNILLCVPADMEYNNFGHEKYITNACTIAYAKKWLKKVVGISSTRSRYMV